MHIADDEAQINVPTFVKTKQNASLSFMRTDARGHSAEAEYKNKMTRCSVKYY